VSDSDEFVKVYFIRLLHHSLIDADSVVSYLLAEKYTPAGWSGVQSVVDANG
jgi:hypothetical protein